MRYDLCGRHRWLPVRGCSLQPAILVIAWLLAAAGLPALADTHHVSVHGGAFSPATLAIRVGDTVVWENGEPGSPHTTTSDLPTSHTNYWSGSMGEGGATFSRMFTSPGPFTYHDQLDFGAGLIDVSASASSATLRSARQQGGRFLFEATGLTVGQTNVLQASTDLTDWTALSTNVAPNAAMSFSNPATQARSFFRLADAGPPTPVDTPYHWECQLPLPQAQEFYGVFALDTGNVWAVGGSLHGGADGTIIHYDGGGWSVQGSELPNALFGVCALRSNDVWAVGARGAILHYDGTHWRPQLSGTEQWLYSVAALDASNVWAVGYGGTILHYDGTAWTHQSSGTAYQLRSVSVLDRTNIWAVGDQGTILHYDGTTWTAQPSVFTMHLRGVCARTATDVWAVGYVWDVDKKTSVLHYDGTSWTAVALPYVANLLSVFAIDANSVWAVGISDAGFHFDGANWSKMSLNAYSVSALDRNHVWMVGKRGSIRFFEQTQGSRQGQSVNGLRAVSASAVDNAWAVGNQGAIVHYDGTGWATQASGIGSTLYGVTALAATQAWAVGDQGIILHYDGMVWSPQTVGQLEPRITLRGVSALDAGNVWAVGAEGTILRYDGETWTRQPSGTDRYLYAVCACDPRNVWAVGQGGTVLHYDGTNWSTQPSGTLCALYSVSALNANNAWAVGYSGTVLHWDGTRWHAQPSGTAQPLWGVAALDTRNVWAAGGDGTILRWNGDNWQNNRGGFGKQSWFWGVCAVDAHHVWTAGFDDSNVSGYLLRGTPGGRTATLREPAAIAPEPWVPPGETLPPRVDLRSEMPPVQNQTSIQAGGMTCGPWAIAYYQLTSWVKHFKRPNWDLTRPEYQMSPAFVSRYGLSRGPMSTLTNYGCVDLAEAPFDPLCGEPGNTPPQLEAARAFRIRDVETLWDHSEDEQQPYTNDLQQAKSRLANGYVLSTEVGTQDGDFPDNSQNPPAVFYDPPAKTAGINHWVVLAGYDDNLNPTAADADHRGGFLLVNCWGDHWNGEMRGCLWVSYAWVKKHVMSAFVLHGDGPNGPAIAACSTNRAAAGESMTLTGTGFGALRRQAGVTFNGLAATVVSFANESITVTVPPGATSGPLIVTDWEGTPCKSTNFTILTKPLVGAVGPEAKLQKR